MKPLRLTLKGFTGIRDGLGREELTLDIESLAADAQLIALVGPNGGGKTTIIDNLHPYRLMPSRATSASFAGFSYYDHLCAAEASKDLEWIHEGRRFRSQLVFRMNGARRTEAFLHEWRVDRWVPVTLPDGTRSDGKADTYDRCIEGVLGSPETFFTSAFHAQNRRQLSAYRPGEIKSLLVELLGLDQIRATGQHAASVAAELQNALTQRRSELAQRQAHEQQVHRLQVDIQEQDARIGAAAASRAAKLAALQSAESVHGECDAARAAATSTDALRQSLQVQLADVANRQLTTRATWVSSVDALAARRERSVAALRVAEASAAATQGRHERDRCAAQTLIARQAKILEAVQTLPTAAEHELAARDAVRAAEVANEACAQLREQLQMNASNRRAVEREAGAAALQARQLQERFALTQRVPCNGTNLQGVCKLLADAREARTLQPSADLQISRLQQQATSLNAERTTLQVRLSGQGDPVARLAGARTAHETVIAQRRVLEADAALAEPLRLAEERLKAIAGDDAAIEQQLQAARAMTRDDLVQCDAAERQLTDQFGVDAAALDVEIQRLAEQLGRLPPPFDHSACVTAERQRAAARQALVEAEATHTATLTQRAELGGKLAAAKAMSSDAGDIAGTVAHLETEVVMWTALTKALGNDGVIALCIDDAGPTLASLTNELLMSCYGPRFTVSITTQVETAKKDLKEGFDVIVFDAETGASKSVAMMSGGEKVWIDAALTRAIAVYLAQSAGRRYQTLFSDEADGPLDADRKRMFVAMKREVLRLGGYEREVFVSQTPELWALADCVIDVQKFAAEPTGCVVSVG